MKFKKGDIVRFVNDSKGLFWHSLIGHIAKVVNIDEDDECMIRIHWLTGERVDSLEDWFYEWRFKKVSKSEAFKELL